MSARYGLSKEQNYLSGESIQRYTFVTCRKLGNFLDKQTDDKKQQDIKTKISWLNEWCVVNIMYHGGSFEGKQKTKQWRCVINCSRLFSINNC